ncbi:MAG TPA: hypothetical protein VFF28_08195 [Candidatus Nanoarchaeia archaeon]|nr:hypothetical protein [Candidatus Nanoarchaeia archaeon]
MTKKGFLITCLLTILLFSGCKSTKTDQEPSQYDYRTGSQGLTLGFPENMPIEVFENDPDIKFLVEVKNKGAFPQTEEIDDFRAKLWLGGYDERILGIYPRLGSSMSQGVNLAGDELEGRSSYNRDGGRTMVEFSMEARELPDGLPYYQPSIIAAVSYIYETLANVMVCVDPEPRSSRVKEKVCNIGDYGVGSGGSGGKGGRPGAGTGSQGAPIAVTRVEEDVTGNNILFNIYVQNMGTGSVILESDVDENPLTGYDWRDLNMVQIGDIKLGNLRMTECRPSIGRDIQLIDGKGIIFCRIDKSAVGVEAYVTPLNIQLRYGYTESIKRSIKIYEVIPFR